MASHQGTSGWKQRLRSLARFYAVLILQEDIEEELRALGLRDRMQQALELSLPVVLTSLALNAITAMAIVLGSGASVHPHLLSGRLIGAGLAVAGILSFALFVLMGSLHLRAGIWFGVFHVSTGCGALAITATCSHSIGVYCWLGFLLGLSTSFCFGWSRAWYQVGLSFAVIVLYGGVHVLYLNGQGIVSSSVSEYVRFLIPNVAGFYAGLYGFHGYLAWGLLALVFYLIAAAVPRLALKLLRWGPVHLDNSVEIVLPFLYRHILLAYDQDPAAVLLEVRFILERRPHQAAAARAALDSCFLDELRAVRNLEDIAKLRSKALLKERWHVCASEEISAFVGMILDDGQGRSEATTRGSLLRRLEDLTGHWRPESSLGKKLRVIANRWAKWDAGG